MKENGERLGEIMRWSERVESGRKVGLCMGVFVKGSGEWSENWGYENGDENMAEDGIRVNSHVENGIWLGKS